MKCYKGVVHILNFALLGSMISCASYHSMESVSEKMDRYHPRLGAPTPSYSLDLPETSNQTVASRGPASAAEPKSRLKYSNKQLYFMTLLDQYYKLGQYSSNTTPEIKHCPANHSALITFKDHYQGHYTKYSFPKIRNFSSAAELEKELTKFPELQLPATLEAARPLVADLAKKEPSKDATPLAQRALEIHLVKTYNELRELCDTGASDNYYAFENLLNDSKKQAPADQKAVMKGAIFSNMALIKSLSRNTGRSIASGSTETLSLETMSRANAEWIKNYYK